MAGIVASPAAAQVSGGLLAGIGSSSISDDQPPDWTARRGLRLGAFVDCAVGSVVGARLEAAYVQKGNRADDGYVRTLDYAEVPLLVWLGASSGAGPRVFAGPLIAFLVHSDALNPNDQDLGWVIGGGYGFERWPVLIDVRYSQGAREAFGNGSDFARHRNEVYTLGLAVTLF